MPRPGTWVRIVELDEIYKSIQAAAKAIDGDQSAIVRVLQGHRKSHKGYTFEKAN